MWASAVLGETIGQAKNWRVHFPANCALLPLQTSPPSTANKECNDCVKELLDDTISL